MKLWVSFSVRAVREISGYEELGLKSKGVVYGMKGSFCKTTGSQVEIKYGPASLKSNVNPLCNPCNLCRHGYF